MSDDCVMLSLKDEFGITDGQQILKLSKDERDVILTDLLRTHAGVRQLQRLTGIGKNIISNLKKKYISRQDTDLSPFPCPSVSSVEDFYPLNTQNPQNIPFNICLTSVDKQLLTFQRRYTSSAIEDILLGQSKYIL